MAGVTFAKKLETVRAAHTPSEVKELEFDHCKQSDMKGLLEEFVNLESLSLVGVGLKNLSDLPSISNLKVLYLSKNSVSDNLSALTQYKGLMSLDLSENNIESADALAPLSELQLLINLTLSGCPVASGPEYPKNIFSVLPQLKYLDGVDRNGHPNIELLNGDNMAKKTNGANIEADGDVESDEDEDDEDDEEEEYGLDVLQRSDELEDDDEEDYAPGDEAELDEYDDDDDDDDEDDVEVDDGANLSGAGVTEPRRPSTKRRHADADNEEPENKIRNEGQDASAGAP